MEQHSDNVWELSANAWSVAAHAHIPPGEPIPVDDASSWDWMDAQVPGDILTLLKQKGMIADPFVGMNDLACHWVEDVDWVYRTQFEFPLDPASAEGGIVLSLDGIDCWAKIFLNRVKLGATENQFREHRFFIEDHLITGMNELLIYIRSAKKVNAVLEAAHGQLPSGFDSGRVFARRCQCLTGWDWAARMSSVAILNSPRIEIEPVIKLVSPFAYVREMAEVNPGDPEADWAVVVAQADVVAQRRAKGIIQVEILDEADAVMGRVETNVTLSPGIATSRMSLRLKEMKTWWPIGMGPRHIHKARFLITGEDRAGLSFSARTDCLFAIRTAAITRKRDEAGESFIPTINGVPIFCRGANWIPVSMLPSNQTPDDYAALLKSAAAAGMNCLRIWGGGIYEQDIFYDICDRMGILVWQDFMFACAAYPTYREFLEEVEAEAAFQIRRLRNHPCLLLWCGNNENEWIHQMGSLRKGQERKVIGEQIWSSLIKDVAGDLDPSRLYHQSSPFGQNRADYNDQGSGDRHNWECYIKWQPPNVYLQDHGRFLSEFGFQSIPGRKTLQTYVPDADTLMSPSLIHHQKMGEGQERFARFAAGMFRIPSSFTDWIDLTQRMQAEYLRRGVEHWRRLKFHTAGALIWQLHDSYPAVSWALIDFARCPKLAYEAARRFFAPVLLSCCLEQDGKEIAAFPVPDQSPVQPEKFPLPVNGNSDLNPDKPSVPKREVSLTLINDTPHTITGRVVVSSESVHGGVLKEIAGHLYAGVNVNSETLRFSLEALEITDICSQLVRARFEPDEQSTEHLHLITGAFKAVVSAIKLGGDVPAVDFSSALQADALLVEPVFFDWREHICVLGQGKPSWH
ncbi:MAG: hypothetical protein NTY46_04485 [Candidatus Sumerlaeota bacterium]|nr:hypothetical protein [Candidatus Sumerlaeota bacterium]